MAHSQTAAASGLQPSSVGGSGRTRLGDACALACRILRAVGLVVPAAAAAVSRGCSTEQLRGSQLLALLQWEQHAQLLRSVLSSTCPPRPTATVFQVPELLLLAQRAYSSDAISLAALGYVHVCLMTGRTGAVTLAVPAGCGGSSSGNIDAAASAAVTNHDDPHGCLLKMLPLLQNAAAGPHGQRPLLLEASAACLACLYDSAENDIAACQAMYERCDADTETGSNCGSRRGQEGCPCRWARAAAASGWNGALCRVLFTRLERAAQDIGALHDSAVTAGMTVPGNNSVDGGTSGNNNSSSCVSKLSSTQATVRSTADVAAVVYQAWSADAQCLTSCLRLLVLTAGHQRAAGHGCCRVGSSSAATATAAAASAARAGWPQTDTPRCAARSSRGPGPGRTG